MNQSRTVPDARVGRRDALRIGGLTVSIAAVVAACGDDREGDTAPGRVGNAPPVTALPEYGVNDAVLLRTASSIELTVADVYKTAKSLDVLDDDLVPMVDRFIADHEAIAAEMGALTEAAGGTAWTSPNPWLVERSIIPILDTISTSDDPSRDVINLAITLENLAAATNQTLAGLLTETEQRVAVTNACALDSRQSATLVLKVFGITNRFSPALVGEDVVLVDGVFPSYAIETTFGSVAQQELIVGAADENGSRTTYVLSTPAANSLIYEELDA